jgi:cell division protein FtsB
MFSEKPQGASRRPRFNAPLRRYIFIGVGVLMGCSAYHWYWWARLSLQEKQLQKQLAVLEERRQRLVEQKQRLVDDPVYVEGLIRSTFKHAKPGEYVIPLTTKSAAN